MCLKDDIKRAQNSSNLTLTSLNDEGGGLNVNSSDFVVTLPPHPNPNNYKQALIQLTSLITPPLELTANKTELEPTTLGVEIVGLGINNSYVSGHSSDLIGHGVPEFSGSLNSQTPPAHAIGHNVSFHKNTHIPAAWSVTPGGIVEDDALRNITTHWRVGDQFYILPRYTKAGDVHDDTYLFHATYNTNAKVQGYIKQYGTHLAIGEVTELEDTTHFDGYDNGSVKNYKLLKHGTKYPDYNFTDTMGNDAVDVDDPGGFYAVWFRWKLGIHISSDVTGVDNKRNQRGAASPLPSGLRVTGETPDVPHTDAPFRSAAAGFVNPRPFFDDAVLCANPFGKRLRVRVVNMNHSHTKRTTGGEAPVTHFETLGKSAAHTAVIINTEHPIVVGLRVMLIDPEDLKN